LDPPRGPDPLPPGAGQKTAALNRVRLARLGITPGRAVALVIGALVVAGAVVLLRPHPQPVPTVTSPSRPSVETLPPVPPSAPAAPELGLAPKTAETAARATPGKAKTSKKTLAKNLDDPFEPGGAADKGKRARVPPPPPNLLHRNDTSPSTNPPQPKAKRSIIREL